MSRATVRALLATGALCAVLLTAACSGSGGASDGGPSGGGASAGPQTPSQRPLTDRGDLLEGQFRPGLGATVDLPDQDPVAVVVLVPGGGWSSADPSGLAPLAASLADAGLAVVTITYGTSGTSDFFPTPPDDVACGVAYAAVQVPGVPVVLAGHSAGAHLAALVGLVPVPDPATTCPSPAHAADAVVGLAGPYDVTRTGGLARALFGVDEDQDPTAWEAGNPVRQATHRPEVPFLLVHGDADPVVPVESTTDFAEALTTGGHDVTVEILPGVDHSSVYSADVVADLIAHWVRTTVVPAG